jgi:hypothetical protein
MDRNFPGADRVARMLATSTHMLIRVWSDIALPRIGGFLPDGSHLTGEGGRWCLKIRVIEYLVDVDGQDTGEMFCLITDLCDHGSYPAAQLAAAYAWRWTGSETSLKEAKSAITGAGPSTGPIFRSATPELITQEHAAWICGTELIRGLARAAARNAAPARRGRLAGRKVQPRQISFTAARRAGLASVRSGAATASLPAPMTRAFRRDTLRALGRRRIVIDRHRHRDRKTKARQAFTAPDAKSAPAPRSPWSASAGRHRPDRYRAPSPSPIPARDRRTWNPRRSRLTQNAVTDTDHAQVHGIGS